MPKGPNLNLKETLFDVAGMGFLCGHSYLLSHLCFTRINHVVPHSAMLTILTLCTHCLNAQLTFGSVVGVVKYPGALLIAGAHVTLAALHDGSSHTTTNS